MTIGNVAVTPQIAEALTIIERLTLIERLQVARYLLDSVLTEKIADEGQLATYLRPYALCAGEFSVPADFDDPLPVEILKQFE
jgi:hypothetical protein